MRRNVVFKPVQLSLSRVSTAQICHCFVDEGTFCCMKSQIDAKAHAEKGYKTLSGAGFWRLLMFDCLTRNASLVTINCADDDVCEA